MQGIYGGNFQATGGCNAVVPQLGSSKNGGASPPTAEQLTQFWSAQPPSQWLPQTTYQGGGSLYSSDIFQ